MDRTATSTIKGFNYQFNKTILEILNGEEDTKIVLEGYIEDIDVFKKDEKIAIQCKYHEASEKFVPSLLTKPILDMITTSFIKDNSIKYKLYLHYKNASKGEKINFDLEMLENMLKTKNIEYVKKYFPIIFKIDDDIKKLCSKSKIINEEKEKILNYFNNSNLEICFDKEKFLKNIEIIVAPSYKELKNDIFSIIINKGYNKEEVENLIYPNMFQKVASISSNQDIEKRTIICGDFRKNIFSLKSLLTSKWLKNIYDTEDYKKILKKHLKIRLQMNSSYRVIILDAQYYKINEIASFINDYTKKYYKKPRLQCCPLFIISADDEELYFKIEQTLYENYNLDFEDGDVGKKFILSKLIDAKNVNLKICRGNSKINEFLKQQIPEDIFAIGAIDMNYYDQNDLKYCKIENLNMNEIKEVFFLGGMYGGNR